MLSLFCWGYRGAMLSWGNGSFVSHRVAQKWLRGLRWSAIDDNLILRHDAGSGGKPIEVDLKTVAPMVLAELEAEFGAEARPKGGPVILCDTSALPWSAAEFRRKWRLVAAKAGVPDSVKNRRGVART